MRIKIIKLLINHLMTIKLLLKYKIWLCLTINFYYELLYREINIVRSILLIIESFKIREEKKLMKYAIFTWLIYGSFNQPSLSRCQNLIRG